LSDVDKKALTATNNNTILSGVACIALAFHFLWCWLFISKMDKREVGVAYALDITFFLLLILQQVYFVVTEFLHNALPDSETFDVSGLLNYLKVGGPSILPMINEIWFWQVLVLAAGTISVQALVAFVAYTNIQFFDVLPIAFGFIASAFVGMNIGMENLVNAKKYAVFSILCACFFSGLFIYILHLNKDKVAGIFNCDEAT